MKQQIIELKALNLQRQFNNNISNNELNNENKNDKDTNRTIEDDYKRLIMATKRLIILLLFLFIKNSWIQYSLWQKWWNEFSFHKKERMAGW